MARYVVAVAGIVFAAHGAMAQFVQQGAKLLGVDAVGNSRQGRSVAISADGNLAIVGGPGDGNGAGSGWVFARSGGVWSQDGGKLVGTGGQNDPFNGTHMGSSVAISGDGSTAIIGSALDHRHAGAVWVFTRSAGGWTQQGSKLVGTSAVGTAELGFSVALSGDGHTAIVGGPRDDGWTGAAWVFTRSDGVWTQQGDKLVGTGAVGPAYQGMSVALSADGNTAVVGGMADDSHAGAAWVFTRSDGVWSQQGGKLVGTGAVGAAQQGFSVGISADGGTAVLGGPFDDSHAGAVWVFIRSGVVWSQQGGKLIGTGAMGPAELGWSVGVSADGSSTIVGGPWDNGYAGAAWVYTRSAGVWSQLGAKLVGSDAVGPAGQGISVALSGGGNTAIVGGWGDNRSASETAGDTSEDQSYNDTVGAAWVFVGPNGPLTSAPFTSPGVRANGSGSLADPGAPRVAAGPWNGLTKLLDDPSEVTKTACSSLAELRGSVPIAPPSRLLGTTLPPSVDLSAELPPVRDQGVGFGTGQTCVAWACVYYQLTQSEKHFEHPSWDLSNPEHQFSVSFAWAFSAGGFAWKAYRALEGHGCTDLAEMPYDEATLGNAPTASQIEAAKPYRIERYAAIWDHTGLDPPYPNPAESDIENAKAWLADGYVLSSSICTEQGDFPDSYGWPPAAFYDPPWATGCHNHVVAIAGFNDDINPSGIDPDHRGGFLMVNSWGPEWNGDMRGFVWLSYAWVKSSATYAYILINGGPDTPSITHYEPQSGRVGEVVTIIGDNFGTNRRASGVSFNGVRASVVSMTNEFVTAIVPEGATSGPLVVYNWEGTPSNQVDFRVTLARPRRHLH